MGGVVSDLDFTDTQLRAMTGGELLRRETLINLGDRREKSVKSAQHLMQALVQTQMVGQLLVNIAQYRQSAIYRVPDSNAHIKYLATVVDDTHQTLVQYLELLRSNLDTDKFDALVPNAVQLMRDYGLDVSLAFMIARASLRSKRLAELASSRTKSRRPTRTATCRWRPALPREIRMARNRTPLTNQPSGGRVKTFWIPSSLLSMLFQR